MLQEAHRAEVSRRGETARLESASRSEAERRDDLFRAATQALGRISDAVREEITEHAPTATVEQDHRAWIIRLNQAALRFARPTKNLAGLLGPWRSPIDVIAHASLTLTVQVVRTSPSFDYKGRSHSLWFCDAKEAGRYQWFETSFMFSPLVVGPNPYPQGERSYSEVEGGIRRANQAPFSLDPGQESAQALSAGMNRFQVAWPFTIVNIGELDEFIDRWAGWLADAAQGRLQHPSELPERSTQGSWRQS